MPAPDLATSARDDAAVLEQVVRAAGDLALKLSRSGAKSWTKEDGTPVSEADLAADRLLRQALTAARPGYGWVSEETGLSQTQRSRRRIWLADPIDGTSAFLKGSGQWCTAVALLEDGRPVLSAIYAPQSNQFYSAALGAGASLNGARLAASQRTALAGARVIAHASLFQPGRPGHGFPPVERGMTTSLSLRLCSIATGQYDATIALGDKSDWDLAPGDLLVHEAGGRVGNLAGERLSYDREVTRQQGLAASGPHLYDEIIRRLEVGAVPS